ncbi:MAG TPA: type VI secretion system tube protein TssD [Hymenobacter sp.]|nr:type VI secretion system tube protein TssD [Hymenobacter sp.]
MASFSATLHLDGNVYSLAWCSYSFHQHIDYRGRPRSKVRKGPIYVELYATDETGALLAWSVNDWKTLSGRIVFSRPDSAATLKHLWFANAFCTGCTEAFDSTGTTGQASLRLRITISPEDMGVEAGNGEGWVAPAARAYAAPVAAITTQPSVTSRKRKVSKDGLIPNTPEHKEARWKIHLAKKPSADYAKWSKQYDTIMRNNEVGLAEEDIYRNAFGGVSKILKTKYTHRQIDIYREGEKYCGQLKTGKLNLGKREITDLKRDAWLIKKKYIVEYILEKGGSKPLIKALNTIGAKITIGRQV